MKRLKKAISVLLVFVMAVSFAVPAFASVVPAKDEVPTVYICGKGTLLCDKDGNTIYNGSTGLDIKTFALEQCKIILPLLAEALITDDWDDYSQSLIDMVAEIYKDVILDKNGEASDGSYSYYQSVSVIKEAADGLYDINHFTFYYDWRLDPYDVTADELNAYIDEVIAVTGSPKVNIIGRCYGSNVAAAYLAKYGNSKVEKLVLYEPTVNGTASCGALFSGNIVLDSDILTRFASDILEEDPLQAFIKATVDVLNTDFNGEGPVLNLPLNAVEYIYNKVADKVLPEAVLKSYGSFPSYWAMTGTDYYEAARDLVFEGREEEYAEFIRKTDTYYQEVAVPLLDDLKYYSENGTEVYVIAKYGKAFTYAVTEDANDLSDESVELRKASLGATTAKVKETLSEEYIENQMILGLERYISPDRQVDTSTCLFPDRTWIIKNSGHNDFIKPIDKLMEAMLFTDGGITIDTYEEYPQYLIQNDEKTAIYPMTEDNCNTETEAAWNPDFIKTMINFISALISGIIALFQRLAA